MRLVDRREFLLATGALTFGLTGCGNRSERPNVLLMTLDTTRRDRLGFYGCERPTSPRLDALAARSQVFSRAIAASSWTLPSHASIFTGKFPASHGAQYDPEGPLRLTAAIEGPKDWELYRARGLSPTEVTLAETLRAAGYRTSAVVAGPWLKRVFGLDRGFEQYDDREIGDVNGRLASEVTGAALRFLERAGDEPFFLFLNYFDPHGPFEAPSPFDGTFGNELLDRYDEEIQYMDYHVGRLFDAMERSGIFDRTLVVVVADHGELLGEHGKEGHGATLFEEEIHVPCLVKYPGGEVAPGTTDRPLHHVDVLPLVLERLGLPVPEGIQGSTAEGRRHPLVSEVSPLPFMSAEGSFRALYRGSEKLLWNSLGNHALYDLEADPHEEVNLAGKEGERIRSGVELVEKYWASLPPPGEAASATALDEETLKVLRSLGYVP